MTHTEYDGPSLVDTTSEQRAGLLPLRGGQGCCAIVTGDHWTGIRCAKDATWTVVTEDAHSGAGGTIGGVWRWSPSHTSAVLCDEHKEQLQAEPRMTRSAPIPQGTPQPVSGGGISIIRLPEGFDF